ncbi:MAG: O-antigen ligase family protein [Sphingorhabdus sp.]
MDNLAQSFAAKRRFTLTQFSTVEWLGILIGVILPIVSAIIYPTYMHMMQTPWVEWSRLLEAPFVICEVFVILWAGRKRMDSTTMWRSMPADIRFTSVFLIIGVFGSSLFLSEYSLRSVTISIITMVHVLFGFSVYYLLRRANVTDFSPFIFSLGAGLISLAALTFWKFAFPPPASAVPGGLIEWSAAVPGFISSRQFGSWTGAIAAGFLVIVLNDETRGRHIWPRAFYFASAAMTVWSGTRAAILAMLIVAVMITLTNRKVPSLKAIGITATLTGAAMTAAWLLLPYNDATFLLFNESDVASVNHLSGGRLELWAATFAKWRQSAFLGWGSGSIFWEVYVGWPHTQPHNAILQFLISWGLVGAIPALWLLARAVASAHFVTLKDNASLPPLAILYALLVMSMLEGMLHYPRFIMLIFVMIAAILAIDANKHQQQPIS